MNKYVGVVFRRKNGGNEDNEEYFIVSQDLIKRGIVEKLFVIINNDFVELTNELTIMEWVKMSDDKKLYNKDFELIEINDIMFEDYMKIYNHKEKKIGQFIVDKYLTHNKVRCDMFLSKKTDDLDNEVFCEYYNRTSNEMVYTQRVLGLDKIIENEELKNKVQDYFNSYKEENP